MVTICFFQLIKCVVVVVCCYQSFSFLFLNHGKIAFRSATRSHNSPVEYLNNRLRIELYASFFHPGEWFILMLYIFCLVPVRHLPKPSRSMHFGDVSDTNSLQKGICCRTQKDKFFSQNDQKSFRKRELIEAKFQIQKRAGEGYLNPYFKKKLRPTRVVIVYSFTCTFYHTYAFHLRRSA